VPWEEVVRGYEHRDHLVVLTKDELETLALKGERTVELFQCVGADEVDPLYFDKAYYLEPVCPDGFAGAKGKEGKRKGRRKEHCQISSTA